MKEGSPPPTCHVSVVTCHVSGFTCHASGVTCHVSRVTCHNIHIYIFFSLYIFLQSGEASQWSVCYQRGLPHLVLFHLPR